MSKVYVVNDGGHDFSAAKRFGSLLFCTRGALSKFNVGQMYREVTEALQHSEPDDYILLTSLTTLCSVACAIFAVKHGRLNLLIFKDNDYVERHVVFNDNEIRNQNNERDE